MERGTQGDACLAVSASFALSKTRTRNANHWTSGAKASTENGAS